MVSADGSFTIRDFKGFISQEQRIDELTGTVKALLVWKKEMEEWRGEIASKVTSLCEVCGASATPEGLVADGGKREAGLRSYMEEFDRVLKRMDELVGENKALREQVKEYEGKVEKTSAWAVEEKKKVTALEEIMKEQKEERDNDKKGFEKAVVGVIRKKENVMREVVDRERCILVYGDVEDHAVDPKERKRKDYRKVQDIMKIIDEDEEGWQGQIEDVTRIGKYSRGEMRPMRVQLRSKGIAEEVMSYSWRLNSGPMRHIRLRKDLNVEQRQKIKELQSKADNENSKLSEEDKKKFFWRVKDGKLRKWFIGTRRKEEVRKEEVTTDRLAGVEETERSEGGTGEPARIAQEVVGRIQSGRREEEET